jgi:hypothetical protein
MTMYEKMEVWLPPEDKRFVYAFVCFRDVLWNIFYVQSMDRSYRDDGTEEIVGRSAQAVELFLETDISEREIGYPSLHEAIAAAMKW